MQGRLASFLALSKQALIVKGLQASAAGGDHRAVKQLARFLEGGQEHASAWLSAPLGDQDCRLLNGFFRVAVAVRLGVNPFSDVDPAQRCESCKQEVGDDLVSHIIECINNAKGDNNRRHQWLQQALSNLLKSIGCGQVLLHPRVLTVFGCGAHENEQQAPVRARERVVGTVTESVEQNKRRQGDIGIIGVLGADQIQLIDITVSDGGGSKPTLPYVPGVLCEKRAALKHDIYHGDNGRFVGIRKGQFVVPSFDQMGGCTEETKDWILHVINAIAVAEPATHRSVIARRVWGTVVTALMRSVAANALEFRNGKLLPPSRKVGALQSPRPKKQRVGAAQAVALLRLAVGAGGTGQRASAASAAAGAQVGVGGRTGLGSDMHVDDVTQPEGGAV